MACLLLVGIQAAASQYRPNQPAMEAYKKGKQLLLEHSSRRVYGTPGTKEEYATAARQFEAATKLDPKFIDAYLALAGVYRDWSSLYLPSENEREILWQKAAALYKKAVSIDPTRADLYLHLIITTKDTDEQISYIEKAIQLAPDHPRAHEALARILLSQGKIDRAYEEYLSHLGVSPYRGRQDGLDHIVFAKSLADRGRPKEAVQIFKKVLALSSEESRFQQCYLFLTLDLKRYTAFKEFVHTVRRLMPYCTNFEHADRAVQLSNEGKIDEAINELKLQLKVNPYYPDTYFLLEDIYMRRKEPGKALVVVKEYFEMEKDPVVRCKVYRRLRKQEYKRLGEQFIEQLKRECEGEKRN